MFCVSNATGVAHKFRGHGMGLLQPQHEEGGGFEVFVLLRVFYVHIKK